MIKCAYAACFFFLCMLLIDMADVCMHVHAADENQALIKVSLDALALASPCPGVRACPLAFAEKSKKRAGLMHACIRPVAPGGQEQVASPCPERALVCLPQLSSQCLGFGIGMQP